MPFGELVTESKTERTKTNKMKIDPIAYEVKRIKEEYALSEEVALEVYKIGGEELTVGKIKEIQIDYGFSEAVALEIYKLSLRKGE